MFVSVPVLLNTEGWITIDSSRLGIKGTRSKSCLSNPNGSAPAVQTASLSQYHSKVHTLTESLNPN